MIRPLLMAAPLILASCDNLPPPMALPEQRLPLENFRSYRARQIVDFSEGDTSRVVSGILRPTGGWSWTRKRAAVKIALRGGRAVRYEIDFAVADETFKTTGPVSVTFFVNDHVLEVVRYAAPGPQHFEETIPAEWLQTENIVGAEVDRVWTSSDDGAQLGLILNRLGLVEE